MLVSWDQGYSDHYLVNPADGARKKILEKFPGGVVISPGGQYLLYYDEIGRNWFTYRILDGKTFNLTEKLGVNFFQEEADTPSDPGSYGNAGWVEGDKAVLIYDKYDIWEVKPDGSGARLATAGFGREERPRLPLRPARSRGADDPGGQAPAPLGHGRRHQGDRLSTASRSALPRRPRRSS